MATFTKNRHCKDKSGKFDTRAEARMAMHGYIRRSGAWAGSYNVYPCKFGNHFHFGHRPGMKKRSRA